MKYDKYIPFSYKFMGRKKSTYKAKLDLVKILEKKSRILERARISEGENKDF